jgi:2-oxoglutarate dehydrogenase E1 component
MGYENQDFGDIAGGVSPAFIETLYARFRTSPDSVEPAWRGFFEGLEGTSSGPSWQQANWPLSTTDDLTAGLDPTQMERPSPPRAARSLRPLRPPRSARTTSSARRATRFARCC